MAIFGGEALEFSTGLDLSGFRRDLKQVVVEGSLTADLLSAAFTKTWDAVSQVVKSLSGGAISTGQLFEDLEARLSTLLGSASAGKQRLDELFQVASQTPFNVDKLTEAEIILESFGANAPVWRQAVMDLSAAMGMDLVDAASAVGRGFSQGAGAADLLRERGVISMVELDAQTQATEMTINEFREALYDTLTDPDGKIAGGATRMAQTFSGLVSNLEDEWTRFQREIADAGFFEGAKAGLRETLGLIDQNRGSIDRLADEIGTNLTASLAFVVTMLGGVADGWTLIQGVVAGNVQAYLKVKRTILQLKETVLEYGRAASQAFQLPDIFVEPLVETRKELNNVQGEISENYDELQRLRDEMGSGYTAAKKIADAILEGKSNTQAVTSEVQTLTGSLGEAALEAGETADKIKEIKWEDGPTLDPVERVSAQLDTALPLWEQYNARVLSSTEELYASMSEAERAAFDKKIADIQDYQDAALGLFGDFLGARLLGEETLGESVRRIGLSFLALQLLDLAKAFGLQAAAFFASGQLVQGGLRLAGAAAATAGAATLEAAAGGSLGGGTSGSSTGTTAASGDVVSAPMTEEQAAEQRADRSSTTSTARSSSTVYIQWKHQLFDAVVQESLVTPGSALQTALRDSSAGVRAR